MVRCVCPIACLDGLKLGRLVSACVEIKISRFKVGGCVERHAMKGVVTSSVRYSRKFVFEIPPGDGADNHLLETELMITSWRRN